MTDTALPPSRPVPGSLGRLGVIQPAPGLMLEAEWMQAVPPGIAFPVTRLALHGATPDGYAAMAGEAPGAAAVLANAGADVIGYACGLGSLIDGPDAERALMERLSVAAGGIPVIGMAQAAVAAMRHHGARRVTLLTPYDAGMNGWVQRYLEACGLSVAGTFGFPVQGAVAAAGLRPSQTVLAAKDAVAGAATDLLWIPCSNVRTMDLAVAIQAVTGCICLSSNTALLAAMLARLETVRTARPAAPR